MSYDLVDPVFRAWAERHSLSVYTTYKDEDVRMARIYSTPVTHRGRVETPHADIALYPIREGEPIHVGVGASRRPRRNSKHVKLEATIETLNEVLEKAYGIAVDWLKESA